MQYSEAGVSVALCTHNGEAFVAEQVETILAQTALPSEIVLSDDASTDATVSIVEATVDDWRRANPGASLTLRVIRNQEPLGVAQNFEQAIAASTGEFIALADQDDVWHSDRIERARKVLLEQPTTMLVHSDARLVDSHGTFINDTLFSAYDVSPAVVRAIRDGAAFEILARRTIVTGAATMFRRELLKHAIPFPSGWVHDEWLAIVASALGSLDVIDEQLIDYRQHGKNQIGAGTLSFGRKLRRMLEPRTDRNARLLERASSLKERFSAMPEIGAERLEMVVEKYEHEMARSELHESRLRRLPAILRELKTGRYSLFGRGLADAVRDLLQPV
jgi:glycosyltransferase involved in cell wall biosynthesis